MQSDTTHEEKAPPVMRLVLEVPADGLRDLVALLAPLKHIAYRSDLWLTERSDPLGRDNGAGETSERTVSREAL